MIVKVLLVGAVLLVAAQLLRPGNSNRRLAGRRLAGVALALLAVVAVLWPATVTDVAHLVGVGRGTDLVLYVAVMFFLFTTVALYQRVQVLEGQITLVVREVALGSGPAPSRGAIEDPVASPEPGEGPR